MTDFINYNRQHFSLPLGCKDMIDVLHPDGLGWLRADFGPDFSGTVVRDSSVKDMLAEIDRHVQRVFESCGLACTLGISPPDEALRFNVAKVNGGAMWASVIVEDSTPRADAVREFFATHSLQLPEDTSTPGRFFSKAPVQLICRILPMSAKAAILSALVKDLFREICSLNDQSELCYVQSELLTAA